MTAYKELQASFDLVCKKEMINKRNIYITISLLISVCPFVILSGKKSCIQKMLLNKIVTYALGKLNIPLESLLHPQGHEGTQDYPKGST